MTTFELFECTCKQSVLLKCTSTFTLMNDKNVKERHMVYTGVCPNCGRYIKRYVGKEV